MRGPGRRERRGRRRRADHLRQRVERRRDGLEGPLPRARTCRTPVRSAEFPPHAHRSGLLARVGEEQQLQRHLRHGMADRKTSCATTPTRLEEAAKRDHRKLGQRARSVLVPERDRIGHVGLASHAAASSVKRWSSTHSAAIVEAGLLLRVHAAHHQERSLRGVRTPRRTTQTACFRRCGSMKSATTTARHQGGPGLLPEAHELPVPHPDLQGAAAQLS